jgi:hypothetical protein
MSRSRGWCWTLNNYKEEDQNKIQGLVLSDPKCRYICFGQEIGESGTQHLQGYLYTHEKISFAQAKALISPRCHIEKQQGECGEAIAYCKKGLQSKAEWILDKTKGLNYGRDALFHEDGEPPMDKKAQGDLEKDRWATLRKQAVASDFDAMDDQMYICHYSNIRAIAKDNLTRPPDAEDVTGVWIQGPSGCGKSSYARKTYTPYYTKNINKWFDGYNAEEYVIMDDLEPKSAEYITTHLKIWCDKYAFMGEIKGGAIYARPNKFIITSQFTINECFPDQRHQDAMRRRCTVIDFFNPTVLGLLNPRTYIN